LVRQISHAPTGEFVLFVKVEDSGSPPLADFSTLRLFLNQKQSKKLAFRNRSYFFTIPEKLAPGTPFGMVTIEIGGRKPHYSIPESKCQFLINPVEGVLYLNRSLQNLNTKKLTFTVKCSDEASGEDTTEVTVEITDSNDNHPIFEKSTYAGFVLENSVGPVYANREMTEILKVRARDADSGRAGLVYYSIPKVMESAGNGGVFEVDHM